MLSVLFVCTANICRSPMAAGLFIAKLGEHNDSWLVESAGIWALEGLPAAENTIRVVAQRGIDLSQHRSRMVMGETLDQFDLILTMEQNHKEALQIEFTAISDRVYLMSEMIDEVYDIRDPVGGSLSEFEDTAKEIELILERGYDKIKDLSSREHFGS